jgi:hypothetical protein
LALVFGPPAYRVSTSGDERAVIGVFWKRGEVHVAAVSGVEWSRDSSRTASTRVEMVEAWSPKDELWYRLTPTGGSGSVTSSFYDDWTEWRCEVPPDRVRITMGGVPDAIELGVVERGIWRAT